jgi:hypothetical protein
VKFVPCSGNVQIVTGGCNGEVRLAKFCDAGLADVPDVIAKHSSTISGLAFPYNNCNNVMSVGRWGTIMDSDIRCNQSTSLVYVS